MYRCARGVFCCFLLQQRAAQISKSHAMRVKKNDDFGPIRAPENNDFWPPTTAKFSYPYVSPNQTFSLSSFLLSSSTRTRFYPQRSSGQAVVTGVVPSPPRYVPLIFIAHRSAFPLLVDFHRMLLTHALALSANHFLCKKKSLRVCALGEN